MDGQTDGWTDGWMDGRRERHLAPYVFLCLCVGMRDMGIWGYGVMGMWGYGDMGIGDMKIWRYGHKGIGYKEDIEEE